METAYTTIKDYTEYRPAEFKMVGGWVRNWFSNFAESPIIIDGIPYRSVECYYQAQKTTDIKRQISISTMSAALAKKAGRNLILRPDWQDIKYDVMKVALLAKFSQEPWKSQLLATGDDMLIEWNNWGDKIWGVTIKDNKGQNLLGMALMEIRIDLRNLQK